MYLRLRNDVAGLCLSFLTAQVTTFCVIGHLPDPEGKVEWPDGGPTGGDVWEWQVRVPSWARQRDVI